LRIDYAILITYVAFVIGIGWTLARYMKTSADFSRPRAPSRRGSRLAFISRTSALELVGMAASGAKYASAPRTSTGSADSGDDLSRVFIAVLLRLQGALGSQYLKMRFDERVRALNSIAFAVMTIFASAFR